MSRSTGREGVAFLAAAVYGQCLVALVYVGAARHSTPAAFGVAASILAIAAWSTSLLDFGFIAYSVRELSAGRMPSGDFYGALLLRSMALVMIAIGLGVAGLTIGNVHYAFIGLIAMARFTSQALLAALRSRGLIGPVVGASFAEPTVTAISFVSLTSLGLPGGSNLLCSVFLGATSSSFIGFLALTRNMRIAGRPRLALQIGRTQGLGFAGLAAAASDLDVSVVAAFVSPALAGEYAAVSRWTRPSIVITHAYVMAASPTVATGTSGRAAFQQIRRALWLPAIAMAYCFTLAIVGPLFVELLLGAEYSGSAPALTVLGLAALIGVPNQILAMFLQYRGHDRLVAKVVVLSVAAQLALVVPLAALMGATGAALANLIGKTLSLGAHAFVAEDLRRRHLQGRRVGGVFSTRQSASHAHDGNRQEQVGG